MRPASHDGYTLDGHRAFMAMRPLPRLLGLACVGLALPWVCAAQQAAPERQVDGGRIDGQVLPSGVHAYLGVPYAEPPVRQLRWKPPQPVLPWAGVFHADRFGPQCMQPQRDAMANHYGGAEVTSEDCLTINVWAPANATKAPVVVYLHGGAFFIGAGSAPIYQGEALARKGAVFITLNYRLGVLGFLAHPELSKESPAGSSGNYGFQDQVAALRWVRRNVASFGGDPERVTVVGQSAGAMSIQVLQASPLAADLFSRAFGMSGAMVGASGPFALRPLAAAESDGQRYQQQVNAASLADLRRMPADRLVASRAPGAPQIGPVLDGQVLPVSVPAAFARRSTHEVPLLLGFTRDESLGGFGPVRTLADYQAKARERFGPRAEEFLALYPATSDAEAAVMARLADRDTLITRPMKAWADMQAQAGRAAVYTTMFARPHRYAPGVRFSDLDPATAGAYHTAEVPFWLGTLDAFNRFRATRDWAADDRQLSDDMVELLVAFARDGVPATPRLQVPRYEPGNPQLLEIGMEIRVRPWPPQHQLDFVGGAARDRSATGTARD